MSKNNFDKHVVDHRENLISRLQNKAQAAAYLSVFLEGYQEDGDLRLFLSGLKDLTDAMGGVQALAVKTGLNREHLYRVFSDTGNPTIETLYKILNALGFTLKAEPKKAA
jgi:probable addiction module antidote protein